MVEGMKEKIESLIRLAYFASPFSSFNDEFGAYLAGYRDGVMNAVARVSMGEMELMELVARSFENGPPNIPPWACDIFSDILRTSYEHSRKEIILDEKEIPEGIELGRRGRALILRGEKHSPKKVS